MDEQLKERIEGYLDAIESSVNSAGVFVVEQTPLVAQEYLAWQFWKCVLVAVVCLVVLVVFATKIRRIYHAIANRKDAICADMDAFMVVLLATITVGAPAFIAGIVHVFLAVKVCLAPRLVLLEKIAELLP